MANSRLFSEAQSVTQLRSEQNKGGCSASEIQYVGGGETAIDLLIATVLSSHGHCESGLAVDSLNSLFIDQTNIF